MTFFFVLLKVNPVRVSLMQNIRQKQEMKWAVAQTPKNAQKFKSDKKAEKLS